MTNPSQLPQRLSRAAPPGSLLKRRGDNKRNTITRGPETDAAHLAAIRQLPCVKCGLDPCGEAMHVRSNSAQHGKKQALGAKPSDCWTVPGCASCHTRDPGALHRIGELPFFDLLGISPFVLAAELYAASPDLVVMRAIVIRHISERKPA